MRLSDKSIVKKLMSGEISIEPLDWDESEGSIKEQIIASDQIQPASVDLRLSNELRIYDKDKIDIIDTKNMPEPDEIRSGEELILNDGEFALASTIETVRISNKYDAEIKGRSSIGRAGSHIHTAGWVDPGFEGQITLELINHAPCPVKLYEGMRIGQIVFGELKEPALVGYGDQKDSKYQNQKGATASRIDEDFK